MAETWRYRGQEIGSEQIVFLREFIRTHPTSSRWKLSRQLCEALGWKQANGALRDMVCRGLLLMLERAGEIQLPAVRRHIQGQCRTGRPRPEAVLIDDAHHMGVAATRFQDWVRAHCLDMIPTWPNTPTVEDISRFGEISLARDVIQLRLTGAARN